MNIVATLLIVAVIIVFIALSVGAGVAYIERPK